MLCRGLPAVRCADSSPSAAGRSPFHATEPGAAGDARTAEPVSEKVSGTQKSVSKSAISRRFVRETETALAELIARDLSELDIKVLMLDGEYMAERCVVVALAITADGTKVPVGLWDGATENKTVVRALLADLVDRGLDFDDGLLVVIDGAKALSAAVREVFGAKALIQRCTLHKRRNIAHHLPDKEKAWVDAKLVKAFNHPVAAEGRPSRAAMCSGGGLAFAWKRVLHMCYYRSMSMWPPASFETTRLESFGGCKRARR